MGEFLKHVACPRCGSSDALALYQGGSSFCFSCRRPGGRDRSPYISDSVGADGVSEDVILPHDASFNYSPACLDWVFSYGVTIDELIKHKVFWSEEKQQLLFTFFGEEKELVLWQARNFRTTRPSDGRKVLKYYTKGKPEACLPIYFSQGHVQEGTLVIVEDCISAIKCSRQCSAMPVLGSSLSNAKLTRLAASMAFLGVLDGAEKQPARVVVWLDGNMYDKAQAIARRLSMLGVPARAVYTEEDPKVYSDTEIELQINA